MRILGIESSCDETAVAIYDGEIGLLSHEVHSQTEIHARFGGVVPELASRDHIAKLLPLLKSILEVGPFSIKTPPQPINETILSSIQRASIQGIAYTAGPGLVGALMVGASFARALGFALQIPAIPIHHMEGHLLAALLEDPAPKFPFLALLVSGGHTLLVSVNGVGEYHILGESLDDAAGEAFDKTAKLLGLGYPGGPALSKLAEEGDPNRFSFPRPLTDRPGLDFSFSGLKTFAMNTLKTNLNKTSTDSLHQLHADIARAFEEAVADTLFIKCKRALKETKLTRLVVAGGVGANQRLRAKLRELESMQLCQLFFPRLEFCTDNAAMIAFAGYLRLKASTITERTSQSENSLEIIVRPRWSMDTLHT